MARIVLLYTAMDGASGCTTALHVLGPLFHEMRELSQDDPARFYSVAAQFAADFESAASQTVGRPARLLAELADEFARAAASGSLGAARH